ncbi:hypothetical protein J6590_064167 [Homalodisca vitripennis]|nr:hypothetical protein J6590_064167 [Homalodisca vitripennis]
MESQERIQPIVVAKPLRAREMLTTVIRKDMLDAMRVVPVKPLSGNKAPVSEKQKEANAEIYHEGYVNGKLYLVPDQNLQAMRDIINLKMRKKHSSVVKPQTSLEEPTQYNEFTTKLDILLDKLDQLSWSSEDETTLEHKAPEKSDGSKIKSVLGQTKGERSGKSSSQDIFMTSNQATNESKNIEIVDDLAKKTLKSGSERQKESILHKLYGKSEESKSKSDDSSGVAMPSLSKEVYTYGKPIVKAKDEDILHTKFKEDKSSRLKGFDKFVVSNKDEGFPQKKFKERDSSKYSSGRSILETLRDEVLDKRNKTEELTNSGGTEISDKHGFETEDERSFNKRYKKGKPSTLSRTDNCGNVVAEEKNDKSETYDRQRKSSKDKRLEGKTEQIKLDKAPSESGTTSYIKPSSLPPILDEKIKYKKVRPLVSLEKEHCLSNPALKLHNELSDNIIIPERKMYEPSYTTEVCRLIISGHFKHGTTPIFIIQQNNNGSNILGKHIPDFKTHKKEGNIDIVLSGKFFTENILIEKTKNSPAVINIKPNKIIIDHKSKIHREKFKDVYNLGPIDIVLEGEFIKDKLTSKFTPVLSLEITKPIHLKDGLEEFQDIPTTVLFSRNAVATTPFSKKEVFDDKRPRKDDLQEVDSYITSKKEKHVHYGEGQEVRAIEELENLQTEKDQERKGILKRIIGNKLFKILTNSILSKNKKNTTTNDKPTDELNQSSQLLRTKCSRKRENAAIRRKPYMKGRKTKPLLSNERPSAERIVPDSKIEMFHTNEENKSSFTGRKNTGNEVSSSPNIKGSVKSAPRRKKKSHTIVENPILAQMQEFFIT